MFSKKYKKADKNSRPLKTMIAYKFKKNLLHSVTFVLTLIFSGDSFPFTTRNVYFCPSSNVNEVPAEAVN